MKLQFSNGEFIYRYMTEVCEGGETWQNGDTEKHERAVIELRFPPAPLHLPLQWVNGGLSRHGPNLNGYLGFKIAGEISDEYSARLHQEFKEDFEYCGHGIEGYILAEKKERIFTVVSQENMALLVMGMSGSKPRRIVNSGEPVTPEQFAAELKQFQEYGTRILNAFYSPDGPNNVIYLGPISG